MTTNGLLLPKNACQKYINGPAGVLDTLILAPKESPRGIAIVFHPDPKGGGSNTNKIVQTIAKVLNGKGYLVYCPNLRGVGQSGGVHDYGHGEVDDGLALVNEVSKAHPGLPLVLAGFSFGSAIASQVATQVDHQYLILIGPAVTRYQVVVPAVASTLVVHGQDDEVISLGDVLDWAKQYDIPVSVFAATGHFFHGKIVQLQNYLTKMVQV